MMVAKKERINTKRLNGQAYLVVKRFGVNEKDIFASY